jgi:signal transduction histidine kinase
LTSVTVFAAPAAGGVARIIGTAGAGGPSSFRAEDREALLRRESLTWHTQGDTAAWHVAVPLGNATPYGLLHVTVSTAQLTIWAKEERQRAYVIAIVTAMLVAGGVGLLTARWVGRPLSAIGEAMGQAHRGATGSPRAPELGAVEFRTLARRYNDLRDALSMRETESEARAALLALEERARGLERLALLEEAAAGFAHEIGTPLGTVRGHLQMLGDDVAEGAPGAAGPRIDLVLGQVDRMADIVRARLRHGAWPMPALVDRPLADIGARLLSFLAPSLAQAGVHAEVVTTPESRLLARCDPKLVEQVLLNLVKNAIEALPRGGRITLTPGGQEDAVWLDIADDGPGLTAETQRQLFNPFVSSKGPDGTGLGLPVSRRIARSLGGDLLHLETSRGTTWRLTLPRAEAA